MRLCIAITSDTGAALEAFDDVSKVLQHDPAHDAHHSRIIPTHAAASQSATMKASLGRSSPVARGARGAFQALDHVSKALQQHIRWRPAGEACVPPHNVIPADQQITFSIYATYANCGTNNPYAHRAGLRGQYPEEGRNEEQSRKTELADIGSRQASLSMGCYMTA